MTITRDISRAMAEQLDRVNGGKESIYFEPLHIPRATNVPPTRAENAQLLRCEELERVIAAQKAVIAELRRRVDGLHVGSRPVLTSKQAAEALGRSVSTVSRYCGSGHLAHVRLNGELFVYADQPLAPKGK